MIGHIATQLDDKTSTKTETVFVEFLTDEQFNREVYQSPTWYKGLWQVGTVDNKNTDKT